MNANVEIIPVRKTATRQTQEVTDLHPAQGILLAVGLSALGWALVLVLLFAM